MENKNLAECLVIYSGKVQGVGFRYQAAQLVGDIPIKGYVRNLTNGTVELIAQGDKQHIELALEAIRSYWGPQIESENIHWRDPRETYHFFSIKRT